VRSRARALRALLAAAAALCALAAAAAGADAPPGGAPPAEGAAGDSTLLIRAQPADTTRVARAPARDTSSVVSPSVIDFEEQRKRGDASLERALQGRRAALFLPLPLFGVPTGTLAAPDAGSRLRTPPFGAVADVATDRTLVAARDYGVGIFDLATTLDIPRADGVETLDLSTLGRSLRPGPFDRAGALLAQPGVERATTRGLPGEGRKERRPKSALYYGNGDEILETGARFVSSTLLKGIGGSYARREANGIAPLRRAVSTRYALAAGLPRALMHSLWVEGDIFDATVEDEGLIVDPFTSAVVTALGRAEIDSRSLTLHGRAVGAVDSRWALRAGEAKRTRVEPNGRRDRWEFPEWSLGWNGEFGRSERWTPLASVHAVSRRVDYASDSMLAFAPRRDEARAGVGLRRSLGRAGGIEADFAADWREASPTLTEGRVSAWGESRRASGRIDLEWAHERPSWVDLLTPERVAESYRLPDQTKLLRISRSGNPDLKPRRLAGALARGSYVVSRALAVSVEGSARRVDDDFGWELTRREVPGVPLGIDTLFVDERAAHRGDGWVSYGALGFVFQPGPLRFRGLGWARSGPDGLSPQAGSPSRSGADGGAGVHIILFQGDLPVDLGLDVHAQGPRSGIVREPGWASCDAFLRADFGPAGAFFEFDNVFDRRVPSALMDAASDRIVPMPGRTFQFGVVWYLLD
jgi:hypothetical protein